MIIQQKQIEFHPEAFEDRYEGALMELRVKSKIAGEQPKVILLGARTGQCGQPDGRLRRSIEEERHGLVWSKAAPAASRERRRPNQRSPPSGKPNEAENQRRRRAASARACAMSSAIVRLRSTTSSPPSTRSISSPPSSKGGGAVSALRPSSRRGSSSAMTAPLISSGALASRMRTAGERGCVGGHVRRPGFAEHPTKQRHSTSRPPSRHRAATIAIGGVRRNACCRGTCRISADVDVFHHRRRPAELRGRRSKLVVTISARSPRPLSRWADTRSSDPRDVLVRLR